MDTIIVDKSNPSPSHTNKRKRNHGQHHRNYQACNLCRMRKVRCDLGSLDNPQTPCAKCRREQRECIFESQPPARSRRSLLPEDSSASPPRLTQPEDVAETERSEHGRNMAAGDSRRLFGPPATGHPETRLRTGNSEQDSTPPAAGSLRAPGQSSHAAPDGSSKSPSSRPPHNSSLVDAVVRTDTDALHLLFSTALQQQDFLDQAAGGVIRPGQVAGLAEEDHAPRSEAFGRTTTPSANRVAERGSNAQRTPASVSRSALSPISAEVAAVWSQFGPCQQRCVTSAEVVAYLDYFFSVLNRQMPILHDVFHDPVTHSTLIAEDPLLCCTILTIASRYLDLSGQMGHSRGYLLHETFFKFVKETLQQLFWGRLFGDESGTTVVGAIESLLLLTQWHPRRIHVSEAFSHLASSRADTSCPSSADRTHDPVMTEAMTSAFRYDSMCWKLTGMAITLANEHGLFDFQQTAQNTTGLCFRGDLRVPHAKKMLYIYSTGLATRLRRVNPLAGISVSSLKKHQPSHLPEKQSEWYRAMNGWIELIDLSSMASDLLYASPQSTRDLIRQGKYISVLRRFELFLSQWWETYQNVDVPHAFKCNSEIEYHYLRIHVYSITIQAIVERSTQFSLGGSSLNLLNGASHSQTSEEHELLKEVVSSCCRVFELIIELHARGSLTSVTVPLLLRVVTVSMFGLKVLGLNLKEELNLTEEDYLISLLDRLVVVLQESAVDDLHLSNHYAQLLERLLKKTKERDLHSSGPLHHHPEGSMSRVTQQDGHRQGSGNVQAFDDDFTEMNAVAADWSEWLAFQSDPTFAAFYANNNVDSNTTSRGDGYLQDNYLP